MTNKQNNKVEETSQHMLTWLRGKFQALEEIEDDSERNEAWHRLLQEFEGMLTSSYEQGKREGWDAAMISVPNPNYSQAEVDMAYEQGVMAEREKWETTVQYNVDAETWDRIRGAIHALEKPTTKTIIN